MGSAHLCARSCCETFLYPRPPPSRRRTRPQGWCLRSLDTREDGPRWAAPAACLVGRVTGPSVSPTTSSPRRLRGGSHSAIGMRHAAGRRNAVRCDPGGLPACDPGALPSGESHVDARTPRAIVSPVPAPLPPHGASELTLAHPRATLDASLSRLAVELIARSYTGTAA